MKNPFEIFPNAAEQTEQQEKEGKTPPKEAKDQEQKDKKPMSTELTPEEKAEKEKVYEEVKSGLATLYESLPRGKKIEVRKVYPRLEGTPLEKIAPYPKDRLAEAIAWEGLNQKPKEEFLARGLEILSLWIHTQALGRVATRRVEELNREMREHRAAAEQQQGRAGESAREKEEQKGLQEAA